MAGGFEDPRAGIRTPGSADGSADDGGTSQPSVIEPGGRRVVQSVNGRTVAIRPTEVALTDVVETMPKHLTHAEVIQLYQAHHASLVRLAALMAPEDGMAEDLVQEAFVRLYKGWRRIREPEKVPAYLRATVVNLARGRGRRISTARRNRPAPPADAASAEDAAMRGEVGREVVAELRRLPTRQRECLVLRYYQGLGESEIAQTLGISVGSVRTHTSRGMAALKSHLASPPEPAGPASRAEGPVEGQGRKV